MPGPGARSSVTLDGNGAAQLTPEGAHGASNIRSHSPGGSTAPGEEHGQGTSSNVDANGEEEEGDRRLAGLLAGLRGEDVEGLLGEKGEPGSSNEGNDAFDMPATLPLK